MKKNKFLTASAVVALAALCVSIYAQTRRSYHDGSVWDVTFMRVKPGMGAAYMDYLSSSWKRNQEERKKAGFILSYKVLTTEPHDNQDFNLILMEEYKDLASLQTNEEKEDELAQKLVGDDKKRMTDYESRSRIREFVGDRLAQEVVLEPKP